MAQHVKALTVKPDHVIWSSRPTWYNERSNSYKLSSNSDIHKEALLQHVHVHMCVCVGGFMLHKQIQQLKTVVALETQTHTRVLTTPISPDPWNLTRFWLLWALVKHMVQIHVCRHSHKYIKQK